MIAAQGHSGVSHLLHELLTRSGDFVTNLLIPFGMSTPLSHESKYALTVALPLLAAGVAARHPAPACPQGRAAASACLLPAGLARRWRAGEAGDGPSGAGGHGRGARVAGKTMSKYTLSRKLSFFSHIRPKSGRFSTLSSALCGP
jgi:hypothetical protein